MNKGIYYQFVMRIYLVNKDYTPWTKNLNFLVKGEK